MPPAAPYRKPPLTGSLHHRDRRTDRRRQQPLTDLWSFEEAAVTVELFDGNVFFTGQNVKTDLERCQRRKEDVCA